MDGGRARFGLLVVALLVLASAWWWWRGDEPPPAIPAPEAPPAAAAAPAAVAATPDAAPVDARTAAAEAPVPAPADALLAHVRGRCVDDDGAPLAGCVAKFGGWGRNSNAEAMQGKVDWKDPEPITTGADGRFDFAFAPPSGLQWSLDVKADGRVPRTGRWGQIQPAQVIDLGDVRLARGFLVTGRVVDERGAPVPKAGVRINNLPLPLAPDMAANDSRYGWSAADGSFQIEVAIPVGTWAIAAEARGLRHVSPDHVTVTARGAEPVLVTVRSMPSIEGIVVDETGQPVKGVGVEAQLNRSGRMAGGRSRADGTFTIHAVDAEPLPVKLAIDDPGPCEPPATADDRVWPWGSRDVRIELRRALTCELVVVERGTGAPVTRYAVSCYSERSRSSLQSDLRLSGDHADGRVTIDRIWRGKTFLQVVPLDPALSPSARIEFLATDAGLPQQRVEIERLQPAVVRVARADGSPFAGSKVEVIVKGTMPFDAGTYAQDLRTGNRSWSSDPQYRAHELVSQATAGDDGRAAVFVAPERQGLVVRATGGHPPAIVDPARFLPGQELVVVPPAAGSLRGIVRVAGLDATKIRIETLDAATKREVDRRQDVKVQADGTFAIDGMLPGRYRLRLTYAVAFRSEHGGSGGKAPLDVPHDDVVVAADQETHVDLDATGFAPAAVRGRVLLDGAPPASARVFLQLQRGARWGQFVPAADGTFEAAGLLPGTYRIGLVVGDFQAGPGRTILADDTFELAAGQHLARDFPFVRRRLVVTVVQTDGRTPAAGTQCQLSGDGLHLDRATDAAGQLVLDPAPAGPVHVNVLPSGKRLGTVQVPAGQTQHEATLTLPQ